MQIFGLPLLLFQGVCFGDVSMKEEKNGVDFSQGSVMFRWCSNWLHFSSSGKEILYCDSSRPSAPFSVKGTISNDKSEERREKLIFARVSINYHKSRLNNSKNNFVSSSRPNVDRSASFPFMVSSYLSKLSWLIVLEGKGREYFSRKCRVHVIPLASYWIDRKGRKCELKNGNSMSTRSYSSIITSCRSHYVSPIE